MDAKPPDNVTLIRPVRLKKDGTPAKPSGFAKGGSHYKGPALGKPASGIPASKIPASGIPAGGYLPFGSAGLPHGPEALIPGQGVEKRAITAQGILDEARAAQECRQMLYHLTHHATTETTQLAAGVALLNRIEGAPVQRSLSNTVATVEEIRKVNARNLSLEERDALRQIIHVAKNRAD